MSEVLPIGDFNFLTEENVASFDLDARTKSDDYGYILEVDLIYPEHNTERNVISLLLLPDKQTRDFRKIISQTYMIKPSTSYNMKT